MSPLRLRRSARALLLDEDDRLLLARHDLSDRHIGRVIWAPPGGGLKAGETPTDAVLRELIEEVGYAATSEDVEHVWHQKVVSSTYARDWDGAILDYFLIRCRSCALETSATAELQRDEGITEFRWWTLSDLLDIPDCDLFRPQQLPALLGELLDGRGDHYPIPI